MLQFMISCINMLQTLIFQLQFQKFLMLNMFLNFSSKSFQNRFQNSIIFLNSFQIFLNFSQIFLNSSIFFLKFIFIFFKYLSYLFNFKLHLFPIILIFYKSYLLQNFRKPTPFPLNPRSAPSSHPQFELGSPSIPLLSFLLLEDKQTSKFGVFIRDH